MDWKTILAWRCRLVARKFDGSKNREYPGRPRIGKDVEELIVQIARENRDWGYDRIAGALSNVGHKVSDQTVGHILKRHGIPPERERKKTRTWSEFIRSHVDVLTATDFFTTEVWTKRGLVTYYVLFFIHVATRRVHITGVTPNPNESWMTQVARNVTMADVGILAGSRYLIHDRDGKFCPAFDETIRAAGVNPIKLPAQSPNLNAYAERWVRSVKEECLSKLILFGEASLRRTLSSYVDHFHREWNHQGKEKLLLFPAEKPEGESAAIRCSERLGGLLKFYQRKAA
jgi:transposase InsO family protein